MRAVAPFPQTSSASLASAQKPARILRIDTNAETAPRAPSEEEDRLRAEVETLREALREAQRQLQQSEVLLQNARIRERELRLQLRPG
jgi:hypothetical protein